jgi:beta-galactosidase
MKLPGVMDIISLNYQGEGIRDAPAYEHLQGIRTTPLYPSFREAHPDKIIISSENASTLSTRGTYLFPVFSGISAPVEDGMGGDPETMYVSGYELYTAQFGASPDKVFRSLDQHPYVGGGFVWSGWDYLGEPTPYYLARSSYCGIIDLAGFKKDRYYLYQARWRPDFPMVHIVPHWNWPDRVGMRTPVHIFTSGDEAELFLNGRSLGRKKTGPYQYRLRWDNILYEPGELRAVAYKNGAPWAEEIIHTTGDPAYLIAEADRDTLHASGEDLSFVTIQVIDKELQIVPGADNLIHFTLEGPGDIIATDNGDPTDFTPFPSPDRNAFNGLALVIVRTRKDQPGEITLHASSTGLEGASIQMLSHGP